MIGQWKIGRTIGKGSSGRVKIARHVITHQYAAIKIVSKTSLINSRMSMSDAPMHAEKILLGIEREIVIMKLIDHPNVLNLYDVWETANELYLIMEYVEGGELFDYLVSQGRIPVDEALHYFQQIISAISYCHGFNIAHRDLKPENLLLSKSNTHRNIKVADFGMAAYTDPTTLLSTSCGSPHYASPEVVEGGSYKGSVSDIWSCGVILYALLVGRLPFDHENLRILLEKVKIATYETPVDIPPAAKDLLSKMLEKDVTQRITMSQIRIHPFFLSAAPSPMLPLSVQIPTLNQLSCQIDRPIQSEEEIDADIFDNMRTLWHGAPAKDIIDGLLNEENTYEKAVYYLLLKYRTKHLENYNMENDGGDHQRGQESPQVDVPIPLLQVPDETQSIQQASEVVSDNGLEQTMQPNETASLLTCTRPSAPTPQRAGWPGTSLCSEKDIDVLTPTLRYVHRTSPIAPQHLALETDMDVFTVTPHDPTLSGTESNFPPPEPLALPVTTLSTLPVINLQSATPIRNESNSTASSSPSPSPIVGIPGIVIPNMDNVDETVQRFFHQIVEHLNNIQMWQSSTSTHSSSGTPEPCSSDAGVPSNMRLGVGDIDKVIESHNSTGAPLPPPSTSASPGMVCDTDDIRFEDATDEPTASSNPIPDFEVLGLGISDYRQRFHKATTPTSIPAQQQEQARLGQLPSEWASPKADAKHPGPHKQLHVKAKNKENEGVRREIVDSLHVRKKSSLRSTEDGRRTLGDKRVQILLPEEITVEEIKSKKRSILSPRSNETSPALSDGSFLLSGATPRKSWFTNLFKFKPATYHLLSVHDAYTTRGECARLLRELGVSVLLADSDEHSILKCMLEEIRDSVGIVVTKAVRFRVELHSATNAHSISGYVTSLTMVQEKGALSSFKLVYNRLRRGWDMDTPPSTRTSSAC
ncbi:Pkinase-domain-containing protein [Ramaria rubella]|nr:Pkinase-domain-containing protein [Ramaria rubella]